MSPLPSPRDQIEELTFPSLSRPTLDTPSVFPAQYLLFQNVELDDFRGPDHSSKVRADTAACADAGGGEAVVSVEGAEGGFRCTWGEIPTRVR